MHAEVFPISFPVSWQIVKFAVIFERHFASALVLDFLSFTIGSGLMPQPAFTEQNEDVVLLADSLLCKPQTKSNCNLVVMVFPAPAAMLWPRVLTGL